MGLAEDKLAQIEYLKVTRQLVDDRTDQRVTERANVRFNSVMTPRLRGIESISSPKFKPGLFDGEGMRMWKGQNNQYYGEWDNLIIRGFMRIWELQVNQIRASNGTLIIGSAGKVAEDGVTRDVPPVSNDWYLEFDHDTDSNLQPFAIGDIIVSKMFWMYPDSTDTLNNAGAYIDLVVARVDAINVGSKTNKIQIDLNVGASSANPAEGMEFVRVANDTDVTRQGLVVLSSDGVDQGVSASVPFVDVYDGLTSYANFLSAMGGSTTFIRARLGRLDAITTGTDEFGLWTDHLILAGGGGSSGVNGYYYGYGAPSGTSYNEGDTYCDLNNRQIYRFESGGWIDTGAIQGVGGALNMPNLSTHPSGLYGTGLYFGYWNAGSPGYWSAFIDNGGNVQFGSDDDGAGNIKPVFAYDNASNVVTIGYNDLVRQRIEIDGDDGSMKFYAYQAAYGTDLIMTFDDNLFGTGTRTGGLNFGTYGMIYKHTETNFGVSTLHSELYNQTAKFHAGISSLISSQSDANTPALSTADIMSAFKGMAHGDPAGNDYIAGGHFVSTKDSGAGKSVGVYLNGSDYGFYSAQDCYVSGELYGSIRVTGGDLVSHGSEGRVYFGGATGNHPYVQYYVTGSVPFEYPVLEFINPDSDVLFYGFTFNKGVSITGALNADSLDLDGGNITDVGNVDGVDVSVFKTAYDNIHTTSYFSIYRVGSDLTITTSDVNIFASCTEDYDVGDNVSSGAFTAPANGYYHFDLDVTMDDLKTDVSWYKISIVANGKTYSTWLGTAHFGANETSYNSLTLSCDVYMTTSSTAIAYVSMNSGGTSGAVCKLGRAATFFNGHRFA